MQIEDIYSFYLQHPSVQTDTRALKEGDLFFALKGPNFNGNLFASQALEKGAAYVFVDEEVSVAGDRIIRVPDVLKTLQDLARTHRMQFDTLPGGKSRIPFLAITGSNGKTTTKELVHAVLSTTFKTYTTRGNLNNHIGIPLTLLNIKADAEMAIIEMGANHLHEIQGYCTYALPTHGLITNCGKAHLEGFGSVENIRKGKGELFDFLRLHQGMAFVNADDPAVVALARGISHLKSYGAHGTDLKGALIKSDPFAEVRVEGKEEMEIQTRLAGGYNLPNILAAVCVGRFFGVEDSRIKAAIEGYQPSNSRSQLIKKGNNTVILDAYNANPSSMKVAIENFAAMKENQNPKVLMLGAM
ncbi:MAG: UDP-N-acetylmuramoyl-tripeptide--D-alanyl-D-alanine ligase, partial [Bacteroidota bacterium]|nr:UDP-N-acetylmuramoyl-tripeptide--D-alanyl-D-alanine ligase [Bacteroidota bacterium]